MAHKAENIVWPLREKRFANLPSYTISLSCDSDFDLSPPEHLLCSVLHDLYKPRQFPSQGTS